MSRYVQPSSINGRVVVRDVIVVDPLDGTRTPGQDVVVEGNRITSVTTTGAPVSGAHVVEGRGRFVVPAFMDMHMHALNTPEDVDGTYALMLANGVVGFRQMSGSRELLKSRREGTLPRPTGAPALKATAGDLLTPLNAGTVDGAVQAVREQHREGADFVKAGMTTRETFLAALEEANRLGIRLGGHLPADLDPREAARGGVWSIEHLGPGVTVFAAASSREAEVRAKNATRKLPPIPKVKIPGAEKLVMKLVKSIAVNPATRTSELEAHAYELADGSYDQQKAEELAALFVEHTTWQCPTLIRVHTQQFGDSPEHTEDPRRRYMASGELRAWDKSAKKFSKLPDVTRDALHGHWAAQLRMTKTFADAGVPMVAGTDACGAAGIIPGFSLHDEFGHLAEAGLDPLTILRMTTIEAARFLGEEGEFGQVAVGMPADLVILDEDPLEDHIALTKIAGVMRNGSWWSRADLDAVVERIAAKPGAH
ncbi:amidohydrolase family protein [Streptomyces beijiangensis]|uniref:Amidohydrolase family protein n=1 Tax=Streptomyces beijiangensis TaxID=163361 RepID=A0A939JHV8_9ACTN|nr:amidohydrolase family protein [Streptomyces beijiangensis]MBO0513047.1 amidohydrolase family protein [Streptomyces beijiangensis]